MSLLGLQRVGDGPTLVWLHGFTQSRDSAPRFRSILAGTHRLLTVDLPGHGENAAVVASLDETADQLVEAIDEERFTLAGYSLGGRVALHVALRHPERLERLVLLSTTAGIEDDEERARRRRRDDALAQRALEIGASAFLDEWLAQPMFATLPFDERDRAARSHDVAGLASSLRHAGTGTQRWLVPELGALRVPTTVIAGDRDLKFTHEADLLGEAIANASVRRVTNAGHAAHLEAPEDVARLFAQPQ